jgi:hypothetical protein
MIIDNLLMLSRAHIDWSAGAGMIWLAGFFGILAFMTLGTAIAAKLSQ